MNNILSFLAAGWGKHKGGGEWAGPCPGCGGKDRFVAWPEHRSGAIGGKYLCRGCAPGGGDCIQFLRDFHGLSYQEACAALRIEAGAKPVHAAAKSSAPGLIWRPWPEDLPSEQWRRRAGAFLAECLKHLSSEAGKAALLGRGLHPDFALRHGLGWNPVDRYEAPEGWGLKPWRSNKGNPGKLYLPAGLVIPTFRKAGPVAVKIRRRDWQPGDTWSKYHAVKGGGNGALILGKPGLPVVLVESELDALLIFQEAPGLCAVMALGSAANRPHTVTADFLKSSPAILAALDFDKPDARGQRAGARAWLWWREHFRQAKRWPPATGKDPGEMHQAGVPIRVWVEAGLAEKTRGEAPQPSDPARLEGKVPQTAASGAAAGANAAGAEAAKQPAAARPRRCLHCSFWRDIPDFCWWVGTCAVTGKNMGSKSVCALPDMAWRGLP